jgi:hypothetical protein
MDPIEMQASQCCGRQSAAERIRDHARRLRDQADRLDKLALSAEQMPKEAESELWSIFCDWQRR